MSLCPFQVQSIVFEGNRFKWLNMTVLLHEVTKKSIYELKFSNNGLEYISPSVLQPSENIHNLDFSNNKLNVMQEIYTDDFERLFWAQTKLRYLNLSHNNLNSIPIQTYSRNILLKILDISYNNIKTLHFSLNQFVGIEKFIASHNKIHIIEHAFRMDMQRILLKSFEDSTDDGGTFFVYLEGNEFLCKCDKLNMKFTDWLHSTEIVHENETLTCNLEGSVVDIRDTGLAETNHMCKMQTIKKTAMIVTPIVASAVILSLITVVFVWRRRKRKSLIRKVIAQIQMGIFPLPHLAFLSYCSEDTDLVMNKIYPELCEHLADMTHSDESLVCLGDKDFRPGFPLRDEVMRSVEESSVFVAIVSRNFCRRAWCNFEIQEAYDQRKPIILLLVEHVEKELMDDFLKKVFDRYAHATWKPDDNGGHIEPEWKIFCRSIIQLAGKSITTEKTVGLPAEIVFVV